MDSDEGKLFIGGIAWDTTEDTLKDYFSSYGEVNQTVIMRDKITGRPRGFGFVAFSNPSLLDSVLQDSHTIDGRNVEVKRALSREEQQASSRTGNYNSSRGGGNFRTKKIFVGGLPSTLTEEGFRQYFENYGPVTDVVIMYDQNTQRPRGFGFISFDTEEAVDSVLQKTFHDLNGKLVEVKRALPKDVNPGGGGYQQGFGASNANTNVFDNRMEGNRYMQPQSAAGFPTYPGYGAAGYGYGAANSAMGYGSYGGYGVGGYGGANAGFAVPAGAYGNPNAGGAGYGSAGPGPLKNTWGGQNPSAYGAAIPWNAPGGGQTPSAASVYRYGNFGGNGIAGGRGGGAPNSGSAAAEQGGAGYMGGSYGDANGNSGY